MKVKKKLKLKKLSSTNIWYVVDIMSIFCSREIGVNKRKKKDLIYYLEKEIIMNQNFMGFMILMIMKFESSQKEIRPWMNLSKHSFTNILTTYNLVKHNTQNYLIHMGMKITHLKLRLTLTKINILNKLTKKLRSYFP